MIAVRCEASFPGGTEGRSGDPHLEDSIRLEDKEVEWTGRRGWGAGPMLPEGLCRSPDRLSLSCSVAPATG